MGTQEDSNQAEEYQTEIAQYKEIIKNSPDDPDTYYRWRMAIAALGFPKEELSEYINTIEQNLNTPEAFNELGFFLSDHKLDERALYVFQKALEREPGNFYALFYNGISFHRLQKYDEAIEQYQKVLKIEPTNASVHDNLGRAYFSLQKYEEAADYLRKALSLDSENSDALYTYGVALHNLQRYDEAIEQYKKTLERKPGYAEVFNRWAITLDSLSKYDEALQKYEKAIEYDTKNAHIYLANQGLALEKLERYDEAIEKYEKALTIKSDYASAYNSWGSVLHKLSKYEEALGKYEKAIKYDPIEAHTYYRNQGLALETLERYDEAIEKYAKALAIKADYASAYNSWGGVLHKLDQFEEALEKYENAIKYDPIEAHTYYRNQGLALEKLGRYDEAIKRYEKALTIKADYAIAYNSWGRALHNLGKFEEALEKYEKAILSDHEDAHIYYTNQALALQRLERYDEAIEKCKESVEAKPDYAPAYNDWGNALVDLGRYEEALNKYEQAIKYDKEEAHVYLTNQGLAFDKLEQYEKAIEKYKEALTTKSDYAGAFNSWGITLFNLGKHKEAIEKYEKAIKCDQNDAHIFITNQGISLDYLGHFDEAIEKYNKVIDGNPSFLSAFFNKGIALEKLSRYEEAIEAYNQAYKIDVDYPYPAHNVANILERQGNLEESSTWWETALSSYSKSSTKAERNRDASHFYHHATIRHYSYKISFEEANAIYKKGYALDPVNPSILLGLAKLYLDLKRQEIAYTGEKSLAEIKAEGHWKSKEYLGRLKNILKQKIAQQKNESSLLQLGEVYFLMGEHRHDQAIDCIQQALEIDENIPRAAELLGKIYLQRNRPRKAIEYFKQELQISPDDLNIRCMVADACLKAKFFDRAENIYREVFEVNQNHLDALLGLGEVYSLKGESESDKEYNETALSEENFNKALHFYAKTSIATDAYRKNELGELNTNEMASFLYSEAYAKVKLYEALPKRSKNDKLLKGAMSGYIKIMEHYKNSQFYHQADTAHKRITRYLQPDEASTTKKSVQIIYLFACIIFVLAQFSFYIGQPVLSSTFVLNETKLKEIIATADSRDIVVHSEMRALLNNLSKQQFDSPNTFNTYINESFEAISMATNGAEVQNALTFFKSEITAAKVLQSIGKRLRFVDFEAITPPYYTIISFGALLFMATAIYLRETTRLKVGAIELEKVPTEQVATSSSLGISRGSAETRRG